MRRTHDDDRDRSERKRHAMTRGKRLSVVFLAAAALTGPWLFSIAAHGIGLEGWGNEPVSPANYGDWPNIAPVINHRSRVYYKLVNEHEWFYYRGDTDALNAALRAFAKVGGEKRVVVLRPGPGQANTLHAVKVPHDWSLHLRAGITRVEGDRERFGHPWDVWPAITIHVGGNVELEKIELPPGVTVLQPADMARRLREQVKDAKVHERGKAIVELAGVDPYSAEDAATAAAMLETDDEGLLQRAAIALGKYGHAARFALPKLRLRLNHDKPYVRQRIGITIEAIENGKPDVEAAKAHAEMVRRIDKFVQGLKDDVP